MAYQVTTPPIGVDVVELAIWIEGELRRISQDLVLLERIEMHTAPSKPYHMQHVLADGTDWNPGSGRGIYYYDGDTATWKFIA